MIDRAPRSTVDVVTLSPSRSGLPAEWPAWVGGHWGAGRPCVVCTEPISPAQAEVRARFREDGARAFHARCFVDWWQAVSAAGAS